MANVNISNPIFDASELPIAPHMPRKSGQGGEGFEQFLQKADTDVSSRADEARASGRSRPEHRSEESRPVSEKSENSAGEKSSSSEKSENSAKSPAENSGKANEKSPVADSAEGKGASGGPAEQAEGAPRAEEAPAQPAGQKTAELPGGVVVAAGKLAGLFAVLPAGLQQQAEGGDFAATPLGEALSLTMGEGEGEGKTAAAPDAPLLQGVPTPAEEQAPGISVAALPAADAQGVSDAAQELLFGGKLPAAAAEGETAEEPRPVHGPAVAEAAHASLAKGVLPGHGPAATASGDGSGSADGEAGKSDDPIAALLRERPVNASGEQVKTDKAGAGSKEQYTHEMAPLTQSALQVAYSERAAEVRTALFGTGDSGEGEGDGLLEVMPASSREVGETLGVRSGESSPLAADGDVRGKSDLPPDLARMDSRLRHEAQRQVFEAAISRMGIAIRDKVAHARIQLDPPALGRVDMELRVESGVLNARVRVEHGWVKESVESNLKTLRDSLQEQGITIAKFTVDVKTGSGSGSFGHFFDHERAENPMFHGAHGEEEGVLELAAVGEPEGYAPGGFLTPGSVNLFA